MRRLRLGSLLQISSVVMKAGWLACYARISTISLLLCPGTEFSQRCLTSVVKGQPRNVCILTTQLAWLVRKDFIPLTHMQTRTPLPAVHHPSQPNLFEVTQHKHTGAHRRTQAYTGVHRRTPMLTRNPSPPAANKNMKSEDSEMKLPAMAQGEFW